MFDSLLAPFAPHCCCVCGELGSVLCEDCKYNIISEPWTRCVFCCTYNTKTGICNKCARTELYKQVWCVGERSGALKQLGDRYKFESERAGADVLASLLDATLPILPHETVVVGIPSSGMSVRRRGFDHVGLVVAKLARQRSLKHTPLLRREVAVTLHMLNKHQREAFADTLFSLRTPVVPDSVLLIDDIVTTGTTLRSAARLLKSAGVKNLYAGVVARQSQDGQWFKRS